MMSGFQRAAPSATTTTVVSDGRVLGGQAVVSNTRIPAATILAYLRDGYSAAEIQEDYPSLPADGIGAVVAWAETKFGADWKADPLSDSR